MQDFKLIQDSFYDIAKAAHTIKDTYSLYEKIHKIIYINLNDSNKINDILLGCKNLKSHLLLQEIRDESHRFSINNVRSKMKREIKKSSIDNIIGIGKVNKTSLLRYFGDLEQIKNASVEDLVRVKGIGKKKASEIFNYLHASR